MTTRLDRRIPKRAKELLAKYGAAAVLIIPKGGTYDPTVGRTTGEVDTEIPVKITPPEPFDVSMVNNDTILSTDMQTYVAALGLSLPPETSGRLRYRGKEYKIERTRDTASGDEIALYWMQLRG